MILLSMILMMVGRSNNHVPVPILGYPGWWWVLAMQAVISIRRVAMVVVIVRLILSLGQYQIGPVDFHERLG